MNVSSTNHAFGLYYFFVFFEKSLRSEGACSLIFFLIVYPQEGVQSQQPKPLELAGLEK